MVIGGPYRLIRHPMYTAARILAFVFLCMTAYGQNIETETRILPKERLQGDRIPVAVLPLLDMSEKKDQEAVCDGIANGISNALSKNDSLQVVGRDDSSMLKGRNLEIYQIAERLKVSYILEGSVQLSGERLRISLQLIRVSDTGVIWSDIFEAQRQDVLSVEDRAGAALARAIESDWRPEYAPKTTNAGRSQKLGIAIPLIFGGATLLFVFVFLVFAFLRFRKLGHDGRKRQLRDAGRVLMAVLGGMIGLVIGGVISSALNLDKYIIVVGGSRGNFGLPAVLVAAVVCAVLFGGLFYGYARNRQIRRRNQASPREKNSGTESQ